jgi:death-on-curing protein
MDGNKRTDHAAMEVFLVLNGFEIRAPVDEQEQIVLRMASSGELERDRFTAWLKTHIMVLEDVVD